MRTPTVASLILPCLLAAAHLPPARARAAAQEQAPAVGQPADDAAPPAVARQLAYLERNPYHAAAFGRALHAAIEAGWLAELEAQLDARLAADETDLTARVLLARLEARAHRPAQALELLAPLEAPHPGLARLRGELEAQRGEHGAAAAWLERALEADPPRHEREELTELLARARLRAGDRAGAAAALGDLAAIEPESFELRLTAGLLLGELGLEPEACAELERAAELALDDVARRVRALVELGRALERRGDAAGALATWARTAELVGPGHWQRSGIFERRLALSGALGRQAELAAELGAAVERAPADPELRAQLARARAASGDEAGALAALERAARDFPSHADLGRALVDALAARGETGRAAAELERLVAAHPRDVELRCELAERLAADGALESAARAWERALALEPASVERRLAVARVQEGFGLAMESEHLLREACALAPGDLRAARELARRYDAGRRASRSEELFESLESQAQAARDAHALEEIAGVWLERERPTRAVRALERALAAGGDRRRLLTSLAVLLEEGRRPARADAALRELIAVTSEPAARADLVARLVDAHRRSRRAATLLRAERRAHRRDPEALVPALVLSAALADAAEFEAAAVPLGQRLARDPDDPDALEHLARLASRRGDHRAAVVHLRRLAELRPAERRATLERIASQHRLAGNSAALAAVYDELVRTSPESRGLYSDLAETHRRARQPEAALDYLRRAVALDPRDAKARLELAALHLRLGDGAAARAELLHALATDDATQRRRARELARQTLARGRIPPAAHAAWAADQAREPGRTAHAVWLALVRSAERDPEGAAAELGSALERFPLEPALLEAREELRGLARAATVAPFDPELAARVRGRPALREELELAALLVGTDELARARELNDALGDPALAAALCLAHGEPGEARRLLTRAADEAPDDPQWPLRLALAWELEGRGREAAAGLERALALGGDSWALLLRLGEAQLARHRTDGAREVGARLFALLTREHPLLEASAEGRALHAERAVQLARFHADRRLARSFLEQGEAALRAAPLDPALLEAVLGAMDTRHARRARALLADLRAAGGTPAGMQPGEWRARLAEQEARFARGSG